MNAKILRRAAQLLDTKAEKLRRDNTSTDGHWKQGTREQRNEFFECLRVARHLRDLAKGVPA